MALAIRDQIDLIIYSQPASDVSIELANFLFGQLYSGLGTNHSHGEEPEVAPCLQA
jgi:hypothetical protein